MFLYGPGGSGKSTFLGAIAAAMGDYAETFRTDMLLGRDRIFTSGNEATPELEKLRGVRLAIANESGQGRRLNEGFIKSITGGDSVTARGVYAKNSTTWKPHFKMCVASNYMPGISDVTDEGMRRRLLIVPFTAPAGKPNTKLKEELSKPENLAGVLAWLVEGCKAWNMEGLGEVSPQMARTMREYYDENDIIADFIADRCTTGADKRDTSERLWMGFNKYQSDIGINSKVIGRRTFTNALKKMEFKPHKGSGGLRFICGLSLGTPAVR